MQTFLNESYIAKRTRLARYAGLVGFGALLLGIFVVGRSTLLSYGLLLVGLLAATVASYLTNMYVREPRPDKVFSRVLDGLDKRYALYAFFLPSSQVVASHYGLTVLVPRQQKGEVTIQGTRYRHKAGLRKLMQFFGEPSVGRPDLDLQHEMQQVDKWIKQRLPDVRIPITGAVVFVHPQVELQVSEATVPVLTAAQLPEFFRQGLRGADVLSTSEQKELRRVLDERVAA